MQTGGEEVIRERAERGARAAQSGLLVNAGLALIKFLAGVLGNSYALVADAVESLVDVFSSFIVWSGLRISARSADEQYPFGYGKAEALAAVVVGLMLVGAAGGISIEAVREIRIPRHSPAPFTLAILIAVIAVKEVLFRRVFKVGAEVESTAVKGDAWHHRSDALTSAAAAVGIGIALIGGPRWAAADDWAALAAAAVILFNGVRILRPAVGDLMDRSPEGEVVERIAAAALSVPEVAATEKLKVRRAGLGLFVDIHVQADPAMSLHDAHVLSGKVKGAIQAAVPTVLGVLVHMEPFEGDEGKTA
ncbi:MAG TPA: cation diffusion facilitator family transporter [Thermoanaerobaculia bacterium]|jgi:cation diffusion facilitator family transporter|nr:cation diffusion facilitator family transporter [Thermoanaerobaculia bacterium]